MRALVTGGGGFLGLYICEQLLDRGASVRVFSRTHQPSYDALGLEWVQGDVRDQTSVGKAIEGCDTVFHAAAVPGIWGPWSLYHGINTVGTENVIEACRNAGVERLVYTSSPSVVFDGRDHESVDESQPYAERYLCHYPHTKALAEKAVLDANADDLATVAIRPHLIWGPRDNHLIPRLLRRAKSGRLRRVGSGDNRISITYVENAAAAHWQVADALKPGAPAAGNAYFINDPKPVILWDWVNELLEHAGIPPVTKSVSQATAWRIGAVMEATFRLLRLRSEPPMTRFLAAQLSATHCYEIGRAVADFGYKPIVSVEEGMKRLLNSELFAPT